MPRKGENIYKRKDGRWEGRYIKHHNADGKAKYGYIYAKSYREVKTRLTDISQGVNIPREKRGTESYEKLLQMWLQHKSISVKESSFLRYKRIVEHNIIPRLGDMAVYYITNETVTGFIGELLSSGNKSGKGLSSKTVSDILVILKSSLTYGQSNGYTVNCNLKEITVKKKDREMRVLSRDEQGKLTAYLQQDMNPYKFGVLLSLYTGMRVGELCALKWESVDLEKRLISIRETLQRIPAENDSHKTKITVTEPKSACSIRDIPIPDCLVSIIRGRRGADNTYILTDDIDRYAEPRVMQYHFHKYIEKLGIAPANYHCLRHTFATRCVEAGFEIKSLSEILGHSNVNITLNRYVHSSFELKAANMNKLTL